jgi:hypothetical protein
MRALQRQHAGFGPDAAHRSTAGYPGSRITALRCDAWCLGQRSWG